MKFIIRLDDACETMNKIKWEKMENLLDRYNIKPIVSIIPENKDNDFNYKYNPFFWNETVKRWINKNWILAQHGCHHLFNKNFQSEFKGNSYNEQKKLLLKGNLILKNHGINPTCFVAPKHSYDNITKKLFADLNLFNFISDGYAFGPFKIKNVVYLPNIFNTPKKILPFGVYTFVYHPNNMLFEDFKNLEKFLIKNKKFFYEIPYYKYFKTKRHRYIQRILLFCFMKIFRKFMRKVK